MRRRSALLILACTAALAACGSEGSRAPHATAAPGATVVWAVGDGAGGAEAAKQVAALIARDRPDHVIYLGDVYESGTREEFETKFAPVYGDLAERMWPTPGNHDWPDHRAGYDPFWRATLGRGLPHHYARKAGGWQVLSANSETPDDPRQLAWLRRRTSRGGDCRIVFWHRPRLNAGFVHRNEQDDVKALWDAIEGRAALALAGHDHDMQRFKAVGGTTEYVSGAGGKDRYAIEASDPRLAFSDDDTDGALRIELRPGRADLRFVAADGKILDRSRVTCDD
jgi:predicted phosphodiesterase